jgi:lysophospholipase L1-like esterase
MQTASANPSDDIENSEIETDPYPSYVMAAIGDSITYGIGAYFTGGYPGILETKLQSAGYTVTIYNQGIPGAHSELADQYFEYSVRGANVALIMIGTNDISNAAGCSNPADCHTIENIRSMIEKSRGLGIVPVLGTITPKRSTGDLAGYNPQIEALNRQIFTLAAQYGIAVADTYQAVLNYGGDALFSDNHHFTDYGYEVIANEWYWTLVDSVLYTIPVSTNSR